MVSLARDSQEVVRHQERLIQNAVVRRARVPRDIFRKEYVGSEVSVTWINKIGKVKKEYASGLEAQREDIARCQKKLKALSKITELSVSEIKDINRRVSLGEAKARRAKKDMVEANLRLVIGPKTLIYVATRFVASRAYLKFLMKTRHVRSCAIL